jgi:hypothetical protein
MGLHPSLHENMLLPYMHSNLAQISCSWVAYVLYNAEDPTTLPRFGNEPAVEEVLTKRCKSEPYTLFTPNVSDAKELSWQNRDPSFSITRDKGHTSKRGKIHRKEAMAMPTRWTNNPCPRSNKIEITIPSPVTNKKKVYFDKLYSKRRVSPKPLPIPQIRKTLAMQPTLYDYAFFKPYCSQSEQDPDVWGHVMESIDEKNTLRLVVQNPNGIKPQMLYSDLGFGLHVCESIGVGVISMSETNVNWNQSWQANATKGFFKKLWQHSTLQPSISEEKFHSAYKPGGTLTAVVGNWTSRVVERGVDPHGMERWSFITLRGSNDVKVIFITAYCVCDDKQVGPKTACKQQHRALNRWKGDVTILDPKVANLSGRIDSDLPLV